MLVFEERGKPEYPEKNLSEQSREPTNSVHIWRRVRESNPGHIGGRRARSPLRQPCSHFLHMKTQNVKIVGTYHVHTSHSIRSVFSLYNRFGMGIKPVPEFPLQLFRNKLSLSKVVVPGVITVAKNHITELHLEKMEEIRGLQCMIILSSHTVSYKDLWLVFFSITHCKSCILIGYATRSLLVIVLEKRNWHNRAWCFLSFYFQMNIVFFNLHLLTLLLRFLFN